MASLRAEYAAAVLHAFASAEPTSAPPKFTDEERETRANKLRAEMHAVLEQGEQPTGYRAYWVRQSAAQIIELLGEIAEQFNSDYADDAATVGDMLDISLRRRRTFASNWTTG